MIPMRVSTLLFLSDMTSLTIFMKERHTHFWTG